MAMTPKQKLDRFKDVPPEVIWRAYHAELLDTVGDIVGRQKQADDAPMQRVILE